MTVITNWFSDLIWMQVSLKEGFGRVFVIYNVKDDIRSCDGFVRTNLSGKKFIYTGRREVYIHDDDIILWGYWSNNDEVKRRREVMFLEGV